MKSLTLPASDSTRDQALIKQIKAQDEVALSHLYDAYGQMVYSLAYYITKCAEDAEDIVIESFWQIWQQAYVYDDKRGQVRQWIVTIVRSRALDHLRALRRCSARETAWSDSPTLPASPNPEEHFQQSEDALRVRVALHTLPPKQREALELAYYFGFSQTEIAAQLGEPLGTIKTRMRLALTKMRAELLPVPILRAQKRARSQAFG